MKSSFPRLRISLGSSLVVVALTLFGIVPHRVAAQTPVPDLSQEAQDVFGYVQKVFSFLAAPENHLPKPSVFDVKCESAAGTVKFLEGRTFHVAAQSLGRIRISTEIDGSPVTICRNGQQIWVHAPKKNLLIIGDPGAPRFSTRPDSVSKEKLDLGSSLVSPQQLLLLPLAVAISSVTDGSGTDYVIEPGQLALKAGINGRLVARVADGDRYPSRLSYDDGKTKVVIGVLPRSWREVTDATWRPQPEPDDKTERVALSHLTRFARTALGNIGGKIPKLGPARGERTLVALAGGGRLENHDGTRVLFLSGTPEAMGRQHGTLLKQEIRDVVDRILYGVGVGSSIGKGRWFFGEIEEAVRRTNPFVDPRHLAEMDAIADAAGLDHEEVRLANFFPELFHCSGFALSGSATVGGKMYHGRVLDYLRGVGLEQNAVVIVSRPSYGHAWVNVSYAGFTGSVTAMNERHIAIGEMGGRGEGRWDGKPMSQLVREVMERAATIDEALDIMRTTPRTCEYYYVISDAGSGLACGVKATPEKLEIIWSGESHPQLPNPIKDTVLMSAGERYEELHRRVEAGMGAFTADAARDLMRPPVCMKSNIQSVLFEPESLDFWVANADKDAVASEARYTKYNLRDLLDAKPATAK
ncbi:MAG: hypothetical protein K1X78_26430 [Verrucomicrobiaceae bacterium]|nr:hypothetical protein [Verrucomicrobiaceae bacterium]